jgi:hypothetical protein
MGVAALALCAACGSGGERRPNSGYFVDDAAAGDGGGARSPGSDLAPSSAGEDMTPLPPDLAYVCGDYSLYKAMTMGVVRSPCAYDVSKILSIGGGVKAMINPPTIHLEFPDGTAFTGATDGQTFTATRLTNFPYQDGCNWQATETLAGTIDTTGSCRLDASYTYREMPVQGVNCAQPCTIDADVVITRQSIIRG